MKTTKPLSETSYTPNTVTFIKTIKISSEILRGDPTGYPSSFPTEQTGSKPGDQSISDPYVLKIYI